MITIWFDNGSDGFGGGRRTFQRSFANDYAETMAALAAARDDDSFVELTQMQYDSDTRTYVEGEPFSLRPSWVEGVESKRTPTS